MPRRRPLRVVVVRVGTPKQQAEARRRLADLLCGFAAFHGDQGDPAPAHLADPDAQPGDPLPAAVGRNSTRRN